VGFQDRFADFFSYSSKEQECDRQLRELERRWSRYELNHLGKYTFLDNTKYQEMKLNELFLAEVLRMSHRVWFNCYFATKIELYEQNIIPLSNQGPMYNIKLLLKNDEFIFQDILDIT
jgi:hypothetical protein